MKKYFNLSLEQGGRPSAVRYRVPQDCFKKLNDIINLWRQLENRQIDSARNGYGIVEALVMATVCSQQIGLFSPWGPRYKNPSPEIKRNDPELETLLELQSVLCDFSQAGVSYRYLIMPADTYGTEINGLSVDFVSAYFSSLEKAIGEVFDGKSDIVVKPWSSIKAENQERCAILRKEVGSVFLPLFEGMSEYRQALVVAQRLNPNNPKESAQRYCLERLIEGRLISEVYFPVKISLVRPEKDTLDSSLEFGGLSSRLYVIRNRAPWMQEGGK